LYVRRLSELQAVALPSTSDGSNPFFSPDGRWIAFFADGKLKKVAVTGGASVTLCDAPSNRGGTWLDDGSIVLAPRNEGGLARVAASGGELQPFTQVRAGERTERWPHALPRTRGVLYTANGTPAGFEDASIVVQPLPSGERKTIVRGGYYARYLASGHLAYVHEGALVAAPFDLDRLEVTGAAVPVLDALTPNALNGAAQYSTSDSGTLVYLRGGSVVRDVPIDWLERDGTSAPLRPTPTAWSNPAFSPDGQRLALQIGGPAVFASSVFLFDWSRDRLSRLAGGGAPVWSPQGDAIAFAASTSGALADVNMYWQRADGTGEPHRLTSGAPAKLPASWHPSGRFLAYTAAGAETTGTDVFVLPLEGTAATEITAGAPIPIAATHAAEQHPAFSPDGRWIAYSSSESGVPEVYVRPFPSLRGKFLVSSGGGTFPTWSSTKPELWFSTISGASTQQIMVTSYRGAGEAFVAEKPQPWSSRRYLPSQGPLGQSRRFAMHPDGRRAAVALAPETNVAINKVVLVTGLLDELRRLAPPAK